MDEPLLLHGIIETAIELLDGIATALLLEPLPDQRLGLLDKADQRFEVESLARTLRLAVVSIGGFYPTAFRRNEEGFDIRFKLLFVLRHCRNLMQNMK